MKRMLVAALSALFILALAIPASALSQGDFIGKGEVQTFFDWNNKQLQDNASRVLVTATTETTWTCSGVNNGGNTVIQERNTTTTTSATTALRERNQITGFFVGGVTSSITNGPAEGTCSNAGFGVTYDGNAETGAPVYSFTLS